MATLVYLQGLTGRGFRVKNSAGAIKVLNESVIVRVDVDDAETRRILAREKDNFVKVAASNSTIATVFGLTRRGFRITDNNGSLVTANLDNGAHAVPLNGRTFRILKRNKGAWIATQDETATDIRGLQEQQNGFEVDVAGSPTVVYQGVTVTVDLTVDFNFQQVRRHFKSWVEV